MTKSEPKRPLPSEHLQRQPFEAWPSLTADELDAVAGGIRAEPVTTNLDAQFLPFAFF